ncbi:MAG: hypothetical protein KC468_18855 [Myxococcales bacterium]|nr:hypothetical protein [Myxococcales bacterium]
MRRPVPAGLRARLTTGAATAATLLAISLLACQGAPQQSAPQKLGSARALAAQTKTAPRATSPFRNPSKTPPPPRSGEQLPPEAIEQAIAAAREQRANNNEIGAASELRKCANKIPQSPRCEAELGLILVDEKMRQADAMYYLKEAVNAPDASIDADLYRRLGEALRAKGQSEDASRAFRYLLEREPDRAENHVALSTALQGVPERLEEAADELAAARELDASNVEWIYDEGLLRAQIAGQAERAVVLLEDYIGKTKGQNPEREQILLGRVAELKATAEMEQSGKPKQPAGDTPGARPVQ